MPKWMNEEANGVTLGMARSWRFEDTVLHFFIGISSHAKRQLVRKYKSEENYSRGKFCFHQTKEKRACELIAFALPIVFTSNSEQYDLSVRSSLLFVFYISLKI